MEIAWLWSYQSNSIAPDRSLDSPNTWRQLFHLAKIVGSHVANGLSMWRVAHVSSCILKFLNMAFKRLSSVELSIGALEDSPLANTLLPVRKYLPGYLIVVLTSLPAPLSFPRLFSAHRHLHEYFTVEYLPILRHSLVASYAARSSLHPSNDA